MGLGVSAVDHDDVAITTRRCEFDEDPGKHAHTRPADEAVVERYNRTVRHEWLDLYIFDTIAEAQSIATNWRWTYNNERPNMGIDGITPAQKLKMAA